MTDPAEEIRQSLKNLYNRTPITYWVVTGVSKCWEQKELIRQTIDRRCVHYFKLLSDEIIIVCRQHGGYDYEALQASIGHFLGAFPDADAIKRAYYPREKGGNE